jgi:cell division protein FtsB
MKFKWVVLSLSFILCFLQYRLWVGTGSLQDLWRLKHIILSQKEELNKQTERNNRLAAEVQAMKANPSALEERARAELGMIKKGETFCLVVDSEVKK